MGRVGKGEPRFLLFHRNLPRTQSSTLLIGVCPGGPALRLDCR